VGSEEFFELGVLEGGDGENVGVEVFDLAKEVQAEWGAEVEVAVVGVAHALEDEGLGEEVGSHGCDEVTDNDHNVMACLKEGGDQGLTEDQISYVVRIADCNSHIVP
jgi:hypothetical protein